MTFHADSNRSGNLLHIETDGAIINIRVGLTDAYGQQVTSVEILPDRYLEPGGFWDLDGYTNNRLIQRHNCAICGRVLSVGQDGTLSHAVAPSAGQLPDGHAPQIA